VSGWPWERWSDAGDWVWWLLLAALLLAALLGVLLTLLWKRRAARWAGSRARTHGLAAERAAEALLEDAGYRVVARQLEGAAHVYIDGVRRESTIKVDLVVERRGRRFVVEVKSGQQRHATQDGTRRQLLEYAHVFAPHDLLLVNTRDGEIHEIRFDYDRIGD
jgi:hypothetical protein